MVDDISKRRLNYMREYLIPEIVAELANETLVKCEMECASGLDGFMSALYNIELHTETPNGDKCRLLIAKLMKGDVTFRESSKSYIQFGNEIFFYARVLPAFAEILAAAQLNIAVDDWVPHAYVAKFGYIAGLSVTPHEHESVLVLEHLKPHGYVLGPRPHLGSTHLLQMCKPIGQYHAISYALRLVDPARLERLIGEIVPLPFIDDSDPNDSQHNMYRVLYRAAFDRLYDFFERKIADRTCDKRNGNDLKLIERLESLRERYFCEPTRLLERIRIGVLECEEDRRFAAILHGDYNRNNVLFRYEEQHGDGEAEKRQLADMKMIDFQELRYGTPCIDLSFFMYMNTSASTRDALWMDMLKMYHENMFSTLKAAVKGHYKVDAPQLTAYSFDKFYAHFARYAFYGVMICLHFLPWMLSSEKECAELSHLFETDLHGEAFQRLSITCGGDEVNMELLSVLRHACEMGYMDVL